MVLAITVIAITIALKTKGVMRGAQPLTNRVYPCISSLTQSITSAWDGKTFLLDADKDSYKNSPTQECVYRGVLTGGEPMDNYPYYRKIYLNVDNGTELIRYPVIDTFEGDKILHAFLERQVEIRGKLVELPLEEKKKFLRPGYITPIGSVCPTLSSTFNLPSNMATVLVDADTDAYKNNLAQECVYRGVLRYVDLEDSYLVLSDGRSLRIKSDMLLESLNEVWVEIRGKYVEPDPGSNRGRELRIGHIASECSRSLTLTPPSNMATILVDADKDSYKNNPAQECVYRGVLREILQINNYPPHRQFYLQPPMLKPEGTDFRQVSIKEGYAPDKIPESLVNKRVEIRGKYVRLDELRGKGLLVGYITLK